MADIMPYDEVRTVRPLELSGGLVIPRGQRGTVVRVLSLCAMVTLPQRVAILALADIEPACGSCGMPIGPQGCTVCGHSIIFTDVEYEDVEPEIEPLPSDEDTRPVPVDAWNQQPRSPLWLIDDRLIDTSPRGIRVPKRKRK